MSVKNGEYFKIIGKNIRRYRKLKGLSQQSLATLCDRVDRSKISDIENAKEDFMYSTLIEVCIALELTPADVVIEKSEDFYTDK